MYTISRQKIVTHHEQFHQNERKDKYDTVHTHICYVCVCVILDNKIVKMSTESKQLLSQFKDFVGFMYWSSIASGAGKDILSNISCSEQFELIEKKLATAATFDTGCLSHKIWSHSFYFNPSIPAVSEPITLKMIRHFIHYVMYTLFCFSQRNHTRSPSVSQICHYIWTRNISCSTTASLIV